MNMRTRNTIAVLTVSVTLAIGMVLPSVALAERGNGHGRNYHAPRHAHHGVPRRVDYRGPRRRGYYGGFGIYLGAPYPYRGYRPYYYPPPVVYPYAYRAPYYAVPPVVAVPAQPRVYIEKGNTATAPEAPAGHWYFCAESNAYYPYVKQCPGGWQQQTPIAPPPNQQ